MSSRKSNSPAEHERSLATVVGQETYSVWVNMLRELVPSGRTHRLAPLVAGMLQFALDSADVQDTDDADEATVSQSLLFAAESVDVAEAEEHLHDVVARLFKDAGVSYKRTSARGDDYGLAESALYEYIHWLDMPWEA